MQEGSLRSSEWPSASQPATGSSSASGTTSSSTPKPPPSARSPNGGQGAQIFVKEVPDPERFGVVVYGDDGRIVDIVEKAGTLDRRYERPPSNDAVVGLYCYGADVFDVIRELEPSERGELEITDVNRAYALRGELGVCRIRGWWRDAGTHEALARIGALIDETGVNKAAP